MKKGLIFLSLFTGLILCIGDMPQVSAQEDQGEEFTLDEIIVTAAKRGEQDLQKVPIAMNVISGEDLASGGKVNVDDILSGLANVIINTEADGMRVGIRGVVDQDVLYTGRKLSSPTVAFNVDGAYNFMNTSGQNLFDVERIEVLEGPQSTLYAANSPGGIVNIITAAPETDRFSADITGLYGNYKHSNLQAILNAPIVNEKLAVRLALNRTRENNFLDPYTDKLSTKNDAARIKLLWNAADNLEITLTGNYTKNGITDAVSYTVKAFDKSSDSAWTAAPWVGGSTEPLDQTNKTLTADISWNSPAGSLTIVPSYSKSNSSENRSGTTTLGPPGPNAMVVPATWDIYRSQTQKGAEARFASSEEFKLFQYVLGSTYYKNEQYNTDTYDPPFVNNGTVGSMDTKQRAVYGNITYPLPFNDKLSFTAGYRKTWDDATQWSISAMFGLDRTEMRVSMPDYKIGFQYDMTDKTMFFGNYTSSFRTNSLAMYNNDGKMPLEELKAYTLGAKTRMFENTLQLNATAYYYDNKNKYIQDPAASPGSFTESQLKEHFLEPGTTTYVTQEDNLTREKVTVSERISYWDFLHYAYPATQPMFTLPDGTSFYMLIDNGFNSWGMSRTYGLDASATWVASANDMVNISLSYMDMKWTELRFNYLYEELFSEDHNYDGLTSPNAPKVTITASYEHNFYIGSYGALIPRIEIQHRSEFDVAFNPKGFDKYAHQEAYTLWNASVPFNSAGGRWGVTVSAKNITNYAVKRTYNSMAQTLLIGDPRTYEASVNIKF